MVRRRLFGELTDSKARDRTVEAFGRMYRQNGTDFPIACREVAYEQQIRASYPIHPEVFERLYEDWSTMERFQRTRGVLRLMAATIGVLWESNDRAPLIMPGSLPLEHPRVRQELTRYLGDAWNAVVDSDIDGDRAASVAIDKEVPRMGQVQACRRVARAIFLGGVPTKATRGIEDVRIKLGTVQPGQQIAVYADALSRMRESLTYLYSSGSGRYWFAVQPNLNRTVADRASKLDDRDVWAELEKRMRLAPSRAEDVPDEDRTRLVVLPPSVGHKRANEESGAFALARAMLESRGTSPRRYRNMLLFLAADADALDTLVGETRRYLAWKSVLQDAIELNLEKAQVKQCEEALSSGDKTVGIQLENAYLWLLVPHQEEAILPPNTPMPFDAVRLSQGHDFGASGTVLQRASYRAATDGHLIGRWSPALLLRELDRYHLWPEDGGHVGVRQLWQYLATYLYLPRLKDREVLLATIKAGAASTDFFGYATSVDGQSGYQGLYFRRQPATVYDDETSVIVKPDEARAAPNGGQKVGNVNDGKKGYGGGGGAIGAIVEAPTTFFGSVDLDALRLSSSASQVGSEVVQHLAALLGADVKVRLEIEAHLPGGVPEHVLRTVTENARTLKFRTAEFE